MSGDAAPHVGSLKQQSDKYTTSKSGMLTKTHSFHRGRDPTAALDVEMSPTRADTRAAKMTWESSEREELNVLKAQQRLIDEELRAQRARAELLEAERKKIRVQMNLSEGRLRRGGGGGDDHGDDGHGGGGHGGGSHITKVEYRKPEYFAVSAMCGVLVGMINYTYCITFGMLLFNHPLLQEHVGLGVNTQTACSFVGGMLLSWKSTCQGSIAAPHIIATLPVALVTTSIAERVAKGTMAPEQLLPTVMAVIVLCTVLVGTSFYALGRFQLTRLVQYLPVCVLNGFLGCIGYKTMLKAVLIATGDEVYTQPGTAQFWKLFLPAVPIGTCMYFMKKWHIGKPIIILPFFLVFPVAIFYIVKAATGDTLEGLRVKGWMPPTVSRKPFYEGWEHLAQAGQVDWGAIGEEVPSLLFIAFIVSIDSLLQLQSTRKQPNCEVLDLAEDMKLTGVANFVCAACGSLMTYSPSQFRGTPDCNESAALPQLRPGCSLSLRVL